MINDSFIIPLVIVRVGGVAIARPAHVLEAVVEEGPDGGYREGDGEDDDRPVGGGDRAGGQIEHEDPRLGDAVIISQEVQHARHYCH